jgi:allophanate hydrolase
VTAVARVEAAHQRIEAADRPEVWITLRPAEAALQDAARIDERTAAGEPLPLAGATLAVKDNIDVAGLPTTAGCPAYAYQARTDAPAVARMRAAGAIVLGKTNLDQFATGLVGTRSPYGAVRDAERPTHVAGGSSSGSAVAVALGMADLALGTDTAGSGRVPAAFQGIVGIKPTRGLVCTLGVVPACRTLDCVTVFARRLADAEAAVDTMTGFVAGDPLGRTWPPDAPLGAPPAPRVGVPRALAHTGAEEVEAFWVAVETLRSAGAVIVPIDLEPFLEVGALLYDGAFVAERFQAVGRFVTSHREHTDPIVGAIIAAAEEIPAHELVRDGERLDRLRVAAMAQLDGLDALLTPTAPFQPTLEEVKGDSVGVNSRLGTFTNFCNLLDMSAVAVPAGRAGGGHFGVTVMARAFGDRVAADVARLLADDQRPALAGGPPAVELLVVGAHLTGQPLNGQLTGLGARLVGQARTAPLYRLYALDTDPPKPGLVRVDEGGTSIRGEIWALPPTGLGSFLASLPAPMSLGKVQLEDNRTIVGFGCDANATHGAKDISAYGGWLAYRNA